MSCSISKLNIYSMPLDFNLPTRNRSRYENEISNLIDYWEKADSIFKSKVLSDRERHLNIETTGFVLEETSDVIFFCSILGKKDESLRNIKVISKKDIRSIKLLSRGNQHPVDGDIVLVSFEDTITNYNIGTKKEILDKVKHSKVDIVGYLMSDSEDDVVMISLIKNIDLKEYKYIMAIPKNVIKNISVLN